MHAMFWRHIRLTAGESKLVLAYVTVSLFGAVLAFCAVTRLSDGAMIVRAPTQYEVWICLCGAIGAATGLYLARHRLGQPGLAGLWQAVIGMALICFAGSLIAGTLALPLYGTMFGPFTLTVILAGSPVLAALWVTNLFGAHLLMGQWRTERDSIFAAGQVSARFTPRPGRHGASIPHP